MKIQKDYWDFFSHKLVAKKKKKKEKPHREKLTERHPSHSVSSDSDSSKMEGVSQHWGDTEEQDQPEAGDVRSCDCLETHYRV